MIKDIQEINFPHYATLSSATATLNDMGENTISTQVKIDGSIVPDFSYDWELEFKGERYIQPLREPQARKDNSSINATIELTFHHWATWEMKRNLFVEMTSIESGTSIADKYIATLALNLGDFCVAFQKVLDYYYDGKIVIDLNQDYKYDTNASLMSISYSYIWDVLSQLYEVFGVRWRIETNNGICHILVGYPVDELSHIFEYGHEKGLSEILRETQDANVRNRLLGRGGSENIPTRYFKNVDPNNPHIKADPDWIPELRNVYFGELRDKVFRDYIQGWKTNPNRMLEEGITIEEYDVERGKSEQGWAYKRGHEDAKFNPIEYVEDKESIAKYGVLVAGLENAEEIHPTIQGISIDGLGRVDEIVAISEILSDDVASSQQVEGTYENAPAVSFSVKTTQENVGKSIGGSIRSAEFSIPQGKLGTLDGSVVAQFNSSAYLNKPLQVTELNIKVYNIENTNQPIAIESPLSQGTYYYVIESVKAEVEPYPSNPDVPISGFRWPKGEGAITFSYEPKLYFIDEQTQGWLPTFDVWIKNVWETSKMAGESNESYIDRVWSPLLTESEASISFSSGWLSSSDYNFPIIKITYDTSKEYNGVQSHWKLTLGKSDAEFEATGLYIPNTKTNGNAQVGDKFYFLGINLPHQYVLWAEEKLHDYKVDQLAKSAEVNPNWSIKFDKISLYYQDTNINVGNSIKIRDERFTNGVLPLYITSITYNYLETSILPDINVTLAKDVIVNKNPISVIQGEIDVMQRQLGSISNVEAIVRQVGDNTYLRKDGIADLSLSITTFDNTIKSDDFVAGIIGGSGWGIFKDGAGQTVIEADRLNIRQDFNVNSLIANQTIANSGKEIWSATNIICTNVVEVDEGWRCYFDSKMGSKTNQFVKDDIAMSQTFDVDNNESNYYRCRVIAVYNDSIILSKSDKVGNGIPSIQDNIIQYGNYNDINRQYVIIRDVIGGGYEVMLSNLNSVDAIGEQYYYVGKSNNGEAIFYVGDELSHIQYDGATQKVNIKGSLVVNEGGYKSELPCFRGEFDVNTTYYKGDEVTFQGATYRYINDEFSLGHFPNDTAYWQVVVEGKVGASIVYRGEYKNDALYYGSDSRVDVVKYGDLYYKAKTSAGEFNAIPNSTSQFWDVFGAQFESIATGLLFSEYAYIDNLGVANLKIGDENNSRIEIIKDNEGGVYPNTISLFGEDGKLKIQVNPQGNEPRIALYENNSTTTYDGNVIEDDTISKRIDIKCGKIESLDKLKEGADVKKLEFSGFNTQTIISIPTSVNLHNSLVSYTIHQSMLPTSPSANAIFRFKPNVVVTLEDDGTIIQEPAYNITYYLQVKVDGQTITFSQTSVADDEGYYNFNFILNKVGNDISLSLSYTINIYYPTQQETNAIVNISSADDVSTLSYTQEFVQTTIGTNGFYSYWGDTQYVYFSKDYGFEVMMPLAKIGSCGIRLGENGLQQYKNGQWVEL